VFGGVFELALTCDLVVADRSARFCFPELRLGIVPGFGGVPRLERDLGNGIVRDLLLSGRSLGAVRAHAIGLVSQVVPKGGAPDAARRLARQVIRVPSETLAVAKRFAKPIPRARLDEEKRLFVDLLSRADVVDALDKFVRDDGVRPYLATEAT
jgi:enoyl-CoA hydratase/carnithine racemase